MKLSALVKLLQKAIEESGDEDVHVMDEVGNEYAVESVSLDGWIQIQFEE